MADTRLLTTVVEDFVRAELADRFGMPFSKRRLQLTVGGDHEFDAVSQDASIVASIKGGSGKTAGGKMPAGKFNNAIAELYFLNFVAAERKILIITNPAFKGLLDKRIGRSLPPQTTIECMALPPGMQAEVDTQLAVASREVSPLALEAAAEAEAE